MWSMFLEALMSLSLTILHDVHSRILKDEKTLPFLFINSLLKWFDDPYFQQLRGVLNSSIWKMFVSLWIKYFMNSLIVPIFFLIEDVADWLKFPKPILNCCGYDNRLPNTFFLAKYRLNLYFLVEFNWLNSWANKTKLLDDLRIIRRWTIFEL